MESDLDFIAASRQDRIIAEQIRRGHQRRLVWIGRWLHQFNWTFDELPVYLAREIPYLSNRGGEALRGAGDRLRARSRRYHLAGLLDRGLDASHGPRRRSFPGRQDATSRSARPGDQPAQALAAGGASPAARGRSFPPALLPARTIKPSRAGSLPISAATAARCEAG